VLLNILRGFGPQAALDAPRFCISSGTLNVDIKNAGRAGDINSEVYFEDGILPETIEQIRGTWPHIIYFYYLRKQRLAMGHDARLLSGLSSGIFGRGQVIQKVTDQSGKRVWAAGSDPRADGHAAPQI